MLQRINLLLLLLLTCTTAWAVESKTRNELPSVADFTDEDCFSSLVFRLKPHQPGGERFLTLAYEEMSQEAHLRATPLLALTYLALREQDPLNSMLPFQAIRLDKKSESGPPRPQIVFTLSGFPGLQRVFYDSLLKSGDSEGFPTRKLPEGQIALGKGWNQPGRARILAFHQNSFFLFPSIPDARQVMASYSEPRPQENTSSEPQPDVQGSIRLQSEESRAYLQDWPLLAHLESKTKTFLAENADEIVWTGNLEPNGEELHLNYTVKFKQQNPPEIPQSLATDKMDLKDGLLKLQAQISARDFTKFYLDVKHPSTAQQP